MFFYVGNEGDVELYVNHTGLMWENAAEFGAMLVFAEHRYFGQSKPFGASHASEHLQFLSTAQALADYAVLITHLKEDVLRQRSLPVIGFGGSYGGMLGSWFRMKYPHIIDGVIAASAPVLLFHGDPDAPPKMEAYAQIITYDATPAAGSAANCVPNIRRVWETVRALGATADGRERLKQAMSMCEDTAVEREEDVVALMNWAKGAFEMMSMGNYPYPSAYVSSDPNALLPAYPMREACSFLADEFSASDDGQQALLSAFAQSVGVYHNSSRAVQCFSVSTPSSAARLPTSPPRDINYWAYLSCAELYGPVTMDGELDMFWPEDWDLASDSAACERQFGVPAALTWAETEYGGLRALRAASNLVFSNGEYDPCAGLGVLQSVSESVVALRIESSAHHLDLMFSNPLDPPAVKHAREVEKQHMLKWIDQVRSV
jgi:lysosomal Pro-X carboxypeptidase